MTRHAHQIQRHTVVLREIEVLRVERVSPYMQRVVFGGESLRGFLSASPDDHVKLFFPNAQGKLVLPTPGPGRLEFPDGEEPSPMRDYTPRHFDDEFNELTVDFVLHGDGPAALWAAQAAPGQRIGAGGPRGSFMVADDFDHYIMIGDETALPAIGRWLDELPYGVRATALVEIPGSADRQPLSSRAEIELSWFERDGADAASSQLLEQALERLTLPRGDAFWWIAAESGRARRMRKYLTEEVGVPKEWVRATGYWKAEGTVDADEE
ncbi:siderophore-interacting protein [Dyella solisilvae]|uniref:Siderophore-interacting protein n=1 Tax=Dyella solisilvae TaxID=1920168 RepID=A0A370K5P3_9GAMM|nr:siderophore-interacting protein [Dyella solisilvae]RDI97975.1 siderophore-interacting protein [Dyella solisilvae]